MKYVNDKVNSLADTLSRHQICSEILGQTAEVTETTYLNIVIEEGSHSAISQDTRHPTLSKIVKFVTYGWPQEKT